MKLPLWRRRQDEELDEELQTHLQMAVQDRVERGETLQAATAAARREFGNLVRVKETTRDQWGWTWIEQVWHDAHYAWRLCLKAPAFTATAVLSLTVGIGANTAIFTLVDAVIVKEMAVAQPDQLVLLTDRDRPGETADYSYPDYEQLRSQSNVLAGLSARASWGTPLTRDDRSEAVSAAFVSASYFEIMRIPALLGRTISRADDSIPANP